MQLVVVMAVRKAVSAATMTFTAISIILFFIRYSLFKFRLNVLWRWSVTLGTGTDVLSPMAQCVPVPMCVAFMA